MECSPRHEIRVGAQPELRHLLGPQPAVQLGDASSLGVAVVQHRPHGEIQAVVALEHAPLQEEAPQLEPLSGAAISLAEALGPDQRPLGACGSCETRCRLHALSKG